MRLKSNGILYVQRETPVLLILYYSECEYRMLSLLKKNAAGLSIKQRT